MNLDSNKMGQVRSIHSRDRAPETHLGLAFWALKWSLEKKRAPTDAGDGRILPTSGISSAILQFPASETINLYTEFAVRRLSWCILLHKGPSLRLFSLGVP